MKLCKDCKHCNPVVNYDYGIKYLCLRKSTIKISLVDGSRIISNVDFPLSCESERYNGECGEKGKYFEEKAERPMTRNG